MIALYAFCREVDDIVDESTNAASAENALNEWRAEIIRLFDKNPTHLISQALLPAVFDYQLPEELFIEIINGMEMDLNADLNTDLNANLNADLNLNPAQKTTPDFAALSLYCYRAASAVGLLSARIFGYQNAQTLRYAHDLGIALQLTNIIRDVGEDAKRGRVYLPLDELAQFGVSIHDIFKQTYSDNFKALMRFQIARAESFYQSALAHLPPEDRQAQSPGLLMAQVYRRILDKIKANDAAHVLYERTRLTLAQKLWILTKWILKK